jgi:hypothetical protein
MVTSMECPICGGALKRAMSIDVCGECHESLSGGAVRMTGEFTVPSPAALAAAEAGDAVPPAQMPTAAGACAWCAKSEGGGAGQVKKLLGRSGVALCNECVALCVDILAAELGDDWRG